MNIFGLTIFIKTKTNVLLLTFFGKNKYEYLWVDKKGE